jgi:hypothetical protein
MHSIHNMYMVHLHEQKIKCDYYKNQLLQCSNDKQKNKINTMIEKYCYNSLSNNSICASVNTCGVTLK